MRVERLERRSLLTTLLVTTAADAGVGSLRDAITQVNSAASSSVTTIDFSIGSGGLQTIDLQSGLPQVNYPVSIDGSSQPGSGTTPRIELNGTNAGTGAIALALNTDDSTVRGLDIDGFAQGVGIDLRTGQGFRPALVEGCFIGTDPTGTVAVPNQTGIRILEFADAFEPSATTITVGGTAAGAGNLIAGNTGDGIAFNGGKGVLVVGNTIGLGADGKALGNGGSGISFGTIVSSKYPIPAQALHDTIGGTAAGQGNTIAGNEVAGVYFAAGSEFAAGATSVSIRGNAIFNNGGLGIDLGSATSASDQPNFYPGNDGATPPAVTSVATANGSTAVGGLMVGMAQTSYNLDFFGNAAADPSGFGEGQQYLGSTTVITGTDGRAAYSVKFANLGSLPVITATATNPAGSTSGFSRAATPDNPNRVADLAVAASATPAGIFPGQTFTVADVVTNTGPDAALNAALTTTLSSSFLTLVAASVGTTDVTGLGNGPIPLGNIAAGASVTYQATYLLPAVDSHTMGPLTQTATLTTDSFNLNASNNTASATVTATPTPVPAPVLAVTASALPSPAAPNSAATISLVLSNPGNAAATNVVLRDTPGALVTGFEDYPGTISLQNGTVVVNIGTFAAGASAVISFTIRTPGSGTLANTGTLTSDQTTTFGGSFALTLPIRPRDVRSDFDGDGVSDVAEYLPTLGAFAIRPSSGTPDQIIPFGIPGAGQSLPATGDYDGDGRTDIAAYLPSLGEFAIRPSSGGADEIIPFGIPGLGNSIPVPGDYDGDGRTDLALYFPAYGAFAYRPSSGGADRIIPFGIAGVGNSIPAPGDYDGDGKTDFAVYLPSLGDYAVRPSSGGADRITPFGASGAGQSIPAPGDYDGDGRTDLAVYLPTYGYYAYRPSSGGADQLIPFGQTGAGQTLPAPGDYDGDGKTDVAADLPAFGLFAVRPSSGGADRLGSFGPAGLGSSVPVSGLASLATPDSGVQAASVATVSAESVPAAVAPRQRVVGSVTPVGPSRRITLARIAAEKHRDHAANAV